MVCELGPTQSWESDFSSYIARLMNNITMRKRKTYWLRVWVWASVALQGQFFSTSYPLQTSLQDIMVFFLWNDYVDYFVVFTFLRRRAQNDFEALKFCKNALSQKWLPNFISIGATDFDLSLKTLIESAANHPVPYIIRKLSPKWLFLSPNLKNDSIYPLNIKQAIP